MRLLYILSTGLFRKQFFFSSFLSSEEILPNESIFFVGDTMWNNIKFERLWRWSSTLIFDIFNPVEKKGRASKHCASSTNPLIVNRSGNERNLFIKIGFWAQTFLSVNKPCKTFSNYCGSLSSSSFSESPSRSHNWTDIHKEMLIGLILFINNLS